MKKYRMTEDVITIPSGATLHRIQALTSFSNVSKGDMGGYIESLCNLENTHVHGNAWVYDDAQVSGAARVYGNAQVSGDAWVYGNAHVHGNACVHGNATVTTGDVQAVVVNLIGVCDYNVTSYGEYLRIGCELHSFSEWSERWTHIMSHHRVSFQDEEKYKRVLEYCEFLSKRRISHGN